MELKRAVNSLNKVKGEPPTYRDSELTLGDALGSLIIKTDEFIGEKIHTAIRKYLGMRRKAGLGPASLGEIYSALVNGGLEFETDNEENRKANIRSILRKSTSIFYRLGNKTHFGLSEWYPGAKNKGGEDDKGVGKKKRRSKGTKSKAKKRDESKIDEPTDKGAAAKRETAQAKSPDIKITQEKAVRAALDAMTGNFKRQDILGWIEGHYPDLNAAQKKTSIFAMLGKLKDEIEVVQEGKGAEPSTYRRSPKMK